ncbi:DUF192 domain-containing protein [Erythrobacter sp. CCH5-A1]|jgi:uncharacterized membrane protein (UPF0127 family)|uniref:DUF192 domain-containing protein n=1 Tax=Erythrobacter sp. CCH5-A1 TaxID=1768792 RepID=UPI000A9D1FFA|nr:DUF192 domain-containing protein [Erythrobacter sp. CCH5-A1]
MVRHILAAAALMLAASACSPGESATATTQASAAATQGPVHPVSGLRVIDLVVTSGGKQLPFKVELADTQEAQAKGLMFRTELGDNEGMIFPSDPPQKRSFWMKNTPLSLDIIFIGVDGRILNIAANTTPYSLDSVKSDGIAGGVLELRAGRAKALGIVPGDKVTW